MNLEERINAFSRLGKFLKQNYNLEFTQKIKDAEVQNPWFTLENQKQAINAWANYLTVENLKAWLMPYHLKENKSSLQVLIIMAGNIPLVGFHDLLSVLITGNNVIVKMSVEDNIILPFIVKKLIVINPEFENRIQFVEDIKGKRINTVIATGSDNSSKYFNYYFKDVKKIIRKNRKSLAILDGTENQNDLNELAKDIFSYFGLGCRNISKLFLPKGYDLNKLFETFFPFEKIIESKKYANNYDYHKAIFLMGNHKITDNGFLLLKEDTSLQSPLAMLYYEFYSEMEQVDNFISDNKEKIQSVVSKKHIAFGQSQNPTLWDYADGVDIIEFLTTN